MKRLALLTIFCALATGTMAAPQDGWNEDMVIFKNNTPNKGNYYRIPAIAATSQGTIVAVSDYRHYGSTDMGNMGTGSRPQKVDFAVKVSHDGGNTWIETKFVTPENGGGVTDPAIVHDPISGKTFLFGFQNSNNIHTPHDKTSFYMFTSEDGGITWDKGVNIKNDVLPEGFKMVFQGPGGGMSYNGTIYVPIQSWHNTTGDKPNVGGVYHDASSGFIYSNDGGKTWETSGLLRPQGIDVTSESNIFHHDGKIYLAAKAEKGNPDKKRVVYATSDNGKTWEKVEEDFIPDDVGECESSSLSLNDQVYTVAYTRDKYGDTSIPSDQQRRHGIYIATNTGRTIEVFDTNSDGYTSMTQDLDNLYILFEGKGDMLMRRYDIASKEYANLNAQILERGQGLLDAQDKLFASRSYIGGEYANNSENGAEAVVLNGNYKIGAFHKKTNENSKDVYRTIEYKTEETTLVLSQDNVITKNDNIFIGYQYTDLEYANKSKNDINSFVIGYSLNHNLENDYIYHLGINGIYSNNKLKRNELEGVGRRADFDTYSISLRNELSKEFALLNDIDTKISFGLDTTVFGHDKIDEEGGIKTIDGGKWNNAVVDKSKNISNEIYAGTELNKNIYLNEKLTLKLGANAEYRKELMDVDDWRDDFTVLDVTKKYATPVEKHEAGVFYTGISAGLDIADKVETSVSYRMDSTGENIFTGTMTYKF